MRLTTAIAATLLGLGFVTGAQAADLPRGPVTKAPAYMAPLYNWTGFYAGLNAGYGWTDSSFGGEANGFVGGGQIGYNWQAPNSPFVFGLEGDFQWADISSSATSGAFTLTGKADALGTIRGRIGYAWDRTMIYGTGGWAYVRNEASLSGPGGTISSDEWSSGWALGGGIEWAAWDRWSVKAEYLYIHSGDVSLTLAPFGTASGDYNINLVRLGLNYRF